MIKGRSIETSFRMRTDNRVQNGTIAYTVHHFIWEPNKLLGGVQHLQCCIRVAQSGSVEFVQNLIEFRPRIFWQIQARSSGVFFKIIEVLRSRNWHNVSAFAQQPGDGNLCGSCAVGRRDFFDGIDQLKIILQIVGLKTGVIAAHVRRFQFFQRCRFCR